MILPSFVTPKTGVKKTWHIFRIFEAFITSPYTVNYPKSMNFDHFVIPKTVVTHNLWTIVLKFEVSINHVTGFKYLGSKMAAAAGDLKRHKALAWSAFWKRERLLKGSQLTISAKVKLFYTCVTIFLYGCESWVLSLDRENKINTFATSCYRIMLGIKWQDCISNNAIYSMTIV